MANWTDPGAQASDVNGWGAVVNITGDIIVGGLGTVDTSKPTPPGKNFSYVVTYSVSMYICGWYCGCVGCIRLLVTGPYDDWQLMKPGGHWGG